MFAILLISSSIPVDAQIESPKKQVKQGIALEEIQCKTGLELVIRNNGNPACVIENTAEKMKMLGIAFNPTPASKSENQIKSIPASSDSIVNFYITDHDLNLAHGGVEIIETDGLLEFTINGETIPGPETMIETGPNTGQFYVKLELPDTVNGKQISQDDIILVKYLDQSDSAGEQRVLVKSVKLSKTFAKVETAGGGSRIGHEFTLRIYEPDANRDSKEVDRISLNLFEFRGEGGIRTTLANPKFDANSAFLLETGPNSNTFEVKIKIPREVDGKPIHIGDKYEIRYIDRSTPSNTDEKIIFNGRIG
ncbi:hypothetical protein [Nitrosopumilus sp.]|uniref:hypothetical protein n=1 Tax=Nitrosopumilus sp. TaxID=2024843 RepID=UPI0026219819|nr:hypothetical protein [Nitrosopumilus sp.]